MGDYLVIIILLLLLGLGVIFDRNWMVGRCRYDDSIRRMLLRARVTVTN